MTLVRNLHTDPSAQTIWAGHLVGPSLPDPGPRDARPFDWAGGPAVGVPAQNTRKRTPSRQQRL